MNIVVIILGIVFLVYGVLSFTDMPSNNKLFIVSFSIVLGIHPETLESYAMSIEASELVLKISNFAVKIILILLLFNILKLIFSFKKRLKS